LCVPCGGKKRVRKRCPHGKVNNGYFCRKCGGRGLCKHRNQRYQCTLCIRERKSQQEKAVPDSGASAQTNAADGDPDRFSRNAANVVVGIGEVVGTPPEEVDGAVASNTRNTDGNFSETSISKIASVDGKLHADGSLNTVRPTNDDATASKGPSLFQNADTFTQKKHDIDIDTGKASRTKTTAGKTKTVDTDARSGAYAHDTGMPIKYAPVDVSPTLRRASPLEESRPGIRHLNPTSICTVARASFGPGRRGPDAEISVPARPVPMDASVFARYMPGRAGAHQTQRCQGYLVWPPNGQFPMYTGQRSPIWLAPTNAFSMSPYDVDPSVAQLASIYHCNTQGITSIKRAQMIVRQQQQIVAKQLAWLEATESHLTGC
jgi:hypothetical protein